MHTFKGVCIFNLEELVNIPPKLEVYIKEKTL